MDKKRLTIFINLKKIKIMEAKKMTLKEAQELVKNTKYLVLTENESRVLQEKLFEIGCKWATGQEVQNTEHPFLYVNEKMILSYSNRGIYMCFEESKKRYMPIEDILIIELEQPKPKFDPRTLQPFDKVLVRDNVSNVWKARFFDRYFCEQLLTTDGLVYNYCIPYNDETKHLHGEIDEAPEFYQQD